MPSATSNPILNVEPNTKEYLANGFKQYYLKIVKPINGNDQIAQTKILYHVSYYGWSGYNAQQGVLSYINT